MGCLSSPSPRPEPSASAEFFSRPFRLSHILNLAHLSLPKRPKPTGNCLLLLQEYYTQIDKDLPRTSALLTREQERHLGWVLKKLVLYFPQTGYTQSMNFVAALFLLLQPSPELALKTMYSVFTHPALMFVGLYEDSFPLCRLCCRTFWHLLSVLQPKLQSRLLNEVEEECFLYKWFLTLFSFPFPVEYAKVFIKFIIEHKDFALAKLAVGVVVTLGPCLETAPAYEVFNAVEQEAFCRLHLPLEKVIAVAFSIGQRDLVNAVLASKAALSPMEESYFAYFTSLSRERGKLYEQMFEEKVVQEITFETQLSHLLTLSMSLFNSKDRGKTLKKVFPETGSSESPPKLAGEVCVSLMVDDRPSVQHSQLGMPSTQSFPSSQAVPLGQPVPSNQPSSQDTQFGLLPTLPVQDHVDPLATELTEFCVSQLVKEHSTKDHSERSK